MADWSRRFDKPIALPDGKSLRTLRDAGHYIQSLPKAKQKAKEWQTAVECLLSAAESRGPMMFAQIALTQALHAGRADKEGAPRRKPAKKYRIVS
jgi:hypothetical protein